MAKAKTEASFEKNLKRLEAIVERMEGEELDLEQSLKIFEEGVALAESCSARLDEAEKKVTLLIKDKQGALAQEPFEEPDDE